MTRLKAGLALVALLALAGGGWLWVGDSSLVAVKDVEITGITSSDGDRVRAALENAALGITTLDVDAAVLHPATAPYASVGDVKVSADFPHRLDIEVIEREPVAALDRPGDP